MSDDPGMNPVWHRTDGSSDEHRWMLEHGRFLRRLARAMIGDDAQAEDAAQDAWVAALEAQPVRNISGWLVTVARRIAQRSARETGRRRVREQIASRSEQVSATESVAARSEIVRLVGDVLADLPEPFRETLLLRYWEGLPPRRISARMGVPVATVQSRTLRGLDRVRAELQRRAPREQWRESLALAVGLPCGTPAREASRITFYLGALMTRTKIWISVACCAVGLGVATTVGVVLLQPKSHNEARGLSGPVLLAVPAQEPDLVTPSVVHEPPGRSASAPSASSVEPRATVAVQVVDANGRLVPDAELLGGADAKELHALGSTSAEGVATLELTPGLRMLCARAEGWAPSPVHTLALGELDATVEPSLELVIRFPMRGTSLVVVVTDSLGAAVSGARVFAGRGEEVDFRLPSGKFVRTAPGFGATTDAGGAAHFSALSPGWLRVLVTHAEHAPSSSFATLESGEDGRLEVVLERGFFVTGRVIDDFGIPVEGARVQCSSSGRAVTSDADGGLNLGPLAPGKVVAVGPLGRRAEARLDGHPGTIVRWDPVLPSLPAVRGRLIDASNAALAGWTVHANLDKWPGWRKGTRTDSEGRFVLYGVPEGPMRLEVKLDPDAPLPSLTREGVKRGLDELVIRVPNLLSTNVRGQLVGSRIDDLPLFLRHVSPRGCDRLTGGPGRAVRLDAEGFFELEDVPAGRCELVLDGPPFGWFQLAQFEALAGREADIGQLVVPVPGVLCTRTWWGAPEPTGDASYKLERRADCVTVLNHRGTFPEELSLAPGRYTLETEVTPGPRQEIEFEIHAGQVTELELELGTTCPHRLQVRYTSGRAPRGEVLVRIRHLDDDFEVYADRIDRIRGNAWSATVDLPPGRYEVVAEGPGGSRAHLIDSLYTSWPGRNLELVFDDVPVQSGM